MNAETLPQLFSKGMRVTLGATASVVEVLQNPQKRDESFSELSTKLSNLPSEFTSFVESLQNPQKRDENFSQLGNELGQLTDELEAKGEVAEQEARTFVESMMAQVGGQSGTSPGSATINTTASTVVDSATQTELEDLTAQLAAVRLEIEKLKDQN